MAATSSEVQIDLSEHFADITDEHIAEFNDKGWVNIPGFVSEELCEQVREHYKQWSGIRWDEWPADPAEQAEFMEALKASESSAIGVDAAQAAEVLGPQR
jgi:hypothetical protein